MSPTTKDATIDRAALTGELAGFAAALADEARALSRRWFRTPVAIDTKADDSPVTIADREVEAALRRRIAERFPDHGIFGEEHGRDRLDSEIVWVIDPIDGTRSFISGWPVYGTLLAVLERGVPAVGVIDMPVLGERWTGRAGTPTLYSDGTGAERPCRTRDCRRLADATVYTTSPDAFDAAGLRVFETVSRQARTRRFGGDCYIYGLVASGHIDLVIEAGLQPYDYLAMQPVIEGAGGLITDWEGKPLTMESDGRVVAAATADLHAETIAAIARAAG
ncbi:histidinol phosphatase-like enzyme (inositol monophosphatase family) [Azospirillum brasilense]|uniref:Histidinol-phosphatase n=1 Tax=Azospirillum brasilense TaxID=192 RepID=A0A560CDF3_AZOBR|nr:histidinol-phosphatase [Azospirillum brasilense]TWA82886.1 histidinol phosphatase-like enzyme (inositol monophosphatase family) [Azospirillum brasilense]